MNSNFLEKKLKHKYNPYHPFNEPEVDYQDIEKWLDEYAKQQAVEFLKHIDKDHFPLYFLYSNQDGPAVSPYKLYNDFLQSQKG